MNYISTKTIESKVEPGVRFVLRRMNERRRQRLNEQQAPAAEKLRPLFDEYLPLNREYGEAIRKSREVRVAERKAAIDGGATTREALTAFPPGPVEFADEKLKRWAELQGEIRKIEAAEQEVTALRYVVSRIEDLEIDGAAAGLDELLEDGPDGLREEILREVKRELGLLPEEVENLSSPSTSPAAVDGAKTTGAAEPAATVATTIAEAAGSSTDPASAGATSTGSTP
jgi:hypothetical protein